MFQWCQTDSCKISMFDLSLAPGPDLLSVNCCSLLWSIFERYRPLLLKYPGVKDPGWVSISNFRRTHEISPVPWDAFGEGRTLTLEHCPVQSRHLMNYYRCSRELSGGWISCPSSLPVWTLACGDLTSQGQWYISIGVFEIDNIHLLLPIEWIQRSDETWPNPKWVESYSFRWVT